MRLLSFPLDCVEEDAACEQVTVLSIAALKKVSKGTKILLLDRNGGQSKAVAKELAKKGFKKVCGFLTRNYSFVMQLPPAISPAILCGSLVSNSMWLWMLQVFVVSNGFSGWTSSKLQTKFSSSVSPSESACFI
jgi:rhodanese-related sulfurtransferase